MKRESSAKPRIKQNRWGNWYGYLGTKRVAAFGNSTTESAEEQAHKWLQEENTMEDIEIEPERG